MDTAGSGRAIFDRPSRACQLPETDGGRRGRGRSGRRPEPRRLGAVTLPLQATIPAPRPISRAAVVTHGREPRIGPALARLQTVARELGVELVFAADEVERHGLDAAPGNPAGADIAVVLGGDGTMLRALGRLLGTGVPVVGVNFGRVGFLASIEPDGLETGLARVFAGEYRVVELQTLEAETDGLRMVAVNDIVAASSSLGRMVELRWNIGGEDLGQVPCDGLICSTPSGSTAYNLSNGGPVLVRGLEAMVVTFVAPHSLHARPLVVPADMDVIIWNRTTEVAAAMLADGRPRAEIPPGGRVVVRVGPERSLLATLPEATFFARYAATFTH
jgi:NAD+ kinase